MSADRHAVGKPADGFCRVQMTVAYDGSGFSGFARSAGVPTVQGALEDAAAKVLGHRLAMSCAGRTDKGVHAVGQVVSFDADRTRVADQAGIDGLARALNRMLNPRIAVTAAALALADFDARFSCIARSYRYSVLNTEIVDPLRARYAWHVRNRLDETAMNAAAGLIIGSHDFAAFAKRDRSRPDQSFVRAVREARWTRRGERLRLDITADAFAHQMVRSLVGMFVEIGSGRRCAENVTAALAARDRSAAPSPAPPHGLVLTKAHYPT